MQFHILVFATFASLIAPFGGFFASGLKRTFKIKDFGDSIPGHGGMTDRMDCQFIMGFFSFVYYQSFIATNKASVGGVIEMAVQGLSTEEIVEVVRSLVKYLVGQGRLDPKVSRQEELLFASCLLTVDRCWSIFRAIWQSDDGLEERLKLEWFR